MNNEKDKAPRGPHSIFLKVLAGYVAVTLLIVVVTGFGSYWLVRQSVIRTNLSDLLSKAQTVAEMLARPDGRVRVLTPKGLYEVEALTDAQLVYVDSDMVTRQMPTREFEKKRPAQSGNSDQNANQEGRWPEGVPLPDDVFAGISDIPLSLEEVMRRRRDASATPAPNATLMPESTPAPNATPMPESTPVPDATPAPEADTSAQESEETLQRINLAGSVDEQLVRSIMGGTASTDVRKLQFIAQPVMFAGTPIVDSESGEVLAAIILCRPLNEVSLATANTLGLMTLAGAAAILCAVVLAWFMSRRITRPISALSDIAGHMAEGHYGERCQVRTVDEIGRLGTTLNLLSARLSEVIGTLSDEKNKLEKILSAIGEGIIAIDREGRVIHHNGAALNLLELKAWELRPDDPHALEHRSQLIDMLHRSMTEARRIPTQWDTVTGRTIEAIASPVVGAGGEISGAVCLVRDVSESQRLEQMRRDYIANISHELRTPLTGIRGMVEPLLDNMMETEQEKRDCYQIIYQETIRLEKLIGEMLDLSRLQDGRIQLELEPMQVEGLLEAAARRMKSRADEGKVELLVEAGPDLAVMGDENRILQVLIILADNALSFTPPGGKVTLFSRRAGENRVALGVRDTGAGIDPVDLPYIWERFYKADRSRMRTGGTGLGLSIAKLAVELMQGEIEVKTRVGEGSAFTFTLNAADLPRE